MKNISYQLTISIGCALFVCLASVIWARLYLGTMINIDIGWLLICVERFMQGGTYSSDFFETNPPLNFLIYWPTYALEKMTDLPFQISLLMSFGAFIAIAATSNYILMKKLGFSATHIAVALTGLILCETWAAGTSFGQRDHLVFIFLVPFCLYQFVQTKQIKIPSPIHIVCIIMGAAAIAIKPHYAIIPMAFFIHRLYLRQSLSSIVLSPDFIGPALFGVLYLSFIFIVTPDYLNTIIPVIIELYTYEVPFHLLDRMVFLSLPVFALGLSFAAPEEEEKLKGLVRVLAALSALSFIPYLLQDKGFHYHLLPSFEFGLLGLYLGIYGLSLNYKDARVVSPFVAGLLLMLATSIYTTGKKGEVFSNQDFLKTDLVQAVRSNAWNGVYTSLGFKTKLQVLPLLTDLHYGSRFQILWPLNNLSDLYLAESDPQKRAAIKEKMHDQVGILVEDIRRFTPSVITIPQYKDEATRETNKSYLNFLLTNPNFNDVMKNYELVDTVEFNDSLTHYNNDPEQLVLHDIFVLKNTAKN